MEVLLHMFERETNYMATVWVALDQFKSFNLKAYCINIQCSFFANIYMNVMTCNMLTLVPSNHGLVISFQT